MAFESALVVLVPEAESLVKSFHDRYDPMAAVVIPAHVTVLSPFKPPDELTGNVIAILQDLISSVPSFNISFQELQTFPDTLYLPPVPAEPFKRLTEIIVGRYPEAPPYSGAFADIVPHLTVAQVSNSQRLAEIAAEFRETARKELPIHARVSTVSLVDDSNGYWKLRTQFSLGPARYTG
jgi:2'-5' RNA ligase